MKKSLTILGSTGSIGTQAIEIARKLGISITALTAGRNITLLEQQIREFKPEIAAVADIKLAADLKLSVSDTNVKVLAGEEGICAAAAAGAEIVLTSMVGIAGLMPTMAAIGAGSDIALANKETLVAAGSLVITAAKKKGIKILPVDSEHSAIFQCLGASPTNGGLKKIILTASGGPFLGKTRKQLVNVSLKEALTHPNWSMGSKITIDSATLMNKGLEVIEAVHLFGVKPEDVEVIVHKESIVHSMVEFCDNSVIAQMGLPDMRIPIQYAFTYPERYESLVGSISFAELSKLTFTRPDRETFSCLGCCERAIDLGGLYPAAVNAANEVAVGLFLKDKIPFLKIGEIVNNSFEFDIPKHYSSLDEVLSADDEVRQKTLERI